MIKKFILDAGPLGRIAHPQANAEVTRKLKALLEQDATIIISEISDYEIRRSLLLEGLTQSVEKLDRLQQVLSFLPLTSDAMRQAAEFWARIRRRHKRTADDKALDGDVILAAQAFLIDATVITENAKHLDQFVPVVQWQEL
ncbi:MAG: PIN domain-containing protein [Chloroflexi bacterium]|nr:PIN domain-containing protein [Chloroflexota bacterium]